MSGEQPAARLYLDTSALVKLVQQEHESAALRAYLRGMDAIHVTSALTRVELVRAVTPGGAEAVAHARRVLSRLHVVALDRPLLDSAAELAPGTLLRSLDAIHLACALLAAPVHAVVTYDERMAEVARALPLPVAAPT